MIYITQFFCTNNTQFTCDNWQMLSIRPRIIGCGVKSYKITFSNFTEGSSQFQVHQLIRYKNLTWTQEAECDLLNLAQTTKTNKTQWPQYRFKIRRSSPVGIRKTMEERIILWKRRVLSLQWKVEGVTDGENEGDDCDEVICAGWGEPGGQQTEWGWRNEEGTWFQRWGDA